MTYAIIKVGGKQHRVHEGERLLVDRLPYEEGATFEPELLLVGGDDEPLLADELDGRQVTAVVGAHVLGKKIIVGKHKRRTGYRRRNGFRARLTQIQIESIGAKAAKSTRTKATRAAATGDAEAAATATEEKPRPRAAAKPKAEAAPAAAEEKPAAKPRSRAKPAEATEGEKPKTTRRRSKPGEGE
jgi:large subunit ribosomal protein L21